MRDARVVDGARRAQHLKIRRSQVRQPIDLGEYFRIGPDGRRTERIRDHNRLPGPI